MLARFTEDNVAELSLGSNFINVEEEDIALVISAATNIIMSLYEKYKENNTSRTAGKIINEILVGIISGLGQPTTSETKIISMAIGGCPCWININGSRFWGVIIDSFLSVKIDQRKLEIPYEYIKSLHITYGVSTFSKKSFNIRLTDGSSYAGSFSDSGTIIDEHINVLSVVGNQELPIITTKEKLSEIESRTNTMNFAGSTITNERLIRDNMNKSIKLHKASLMELLP